MRIHRLLPWPIAVTVALGILFIPSTGTSVAGRVASTAADEASQSGAPSVWSTVLNSRERLDVAVSLAKVRASAGAAGKVITARLTELKDGIDSAVAAAAKPLPYEIEYAALAFLPGPYLLARQAWARVSQVYAAVRSRTETIEGAVSAWTAELGAEKERIRAAAEAARIAAASRGGAAAALRPGESPYNRVARVANTLPFTVAFVMVGGCPGGSLACYQLGSAYIGMTSAGASRSECRIRTILAHEYRHTRQWNEGIVQLDGGQVLNRSWLESDAQAFARSYGC